MPIRYLTVEEVFFLNQIIIQTTSPMESIGILHHDLLESAVYRSQQSVLGEDAYPSLEQKAAALFESLCQNHCFHNANKRTAFMAMAQFLAYNGRELVMNTDFKVGFTLDVTTKRLDLVESAFIILQYSRPI